MLTAGMSIRAVSRELNIHSSTIICFQKHFRLLGCTSNWSHHGRPSITTPAQDVHIQHIHLQDHLRPDTRKAAETIGLHNQRISVETVRNCLREAHLYAHHPHLGLDRTAVCHRNKLEWASAHIPWRTPQWRGVLFTEQYRLSLFRADGRKHVWCCVDERFADVTVVDRVTHSGGGVMVWAGVCHGHRTKVHFIDGFLIAETP